MKAIQIDKPGGAEVLTLTERETPKPAPGELLIKVAAAGVNRPDVLQRRGHYPPPPGVTDIPGLEIAGTVEKLGPGAVGRVGERVMALLPGGGYAEYATVHHRHVLPIPDDMPFQRAAGIPETLYTVWANVFELGGLKEDETLFVHGATSGIGTMAASLALAFSAEVYGTAGTDQKCSQAEKLGFAKCFNYQSTDWVAEIGKVGGADVVLDMVGGDYVARNLALMNPKGRHVSIAFLGGLNAEVPILPIMQKQLTLTGSTLRARDVEEKARLTDQIRQHVLPKLATGEVAPVIDCGFPLAKAAEAHQRMEAGDHVGKIILVT